jgi:SAM-dependent methyltransferase
MSGMPDVYTHGHHESVLRAHRWRTAENSAAFLLKEIEPAMSILDVGCGPGTITAGLADRVPAGHVTGIDAESAVLEQARELAGGRDNLDFATGDVYALDYPDDTFSVVHAHQVLQHLGDPVAALREMRRVCRPGGLVAVRDGDYGAMIWYPALPELDAWRDLYRTVARANGGEPDAGRHLHAWARQAGLTGRQVSTSTWTYAAPEERAFWGGLWAERTVTSPYVGMAVAGGHASHDDLQRIADGWRSWTAHADGWFTVVNGEVLCQVA